VALEEAIEVFWIKGYHNTSVEDIVETTGLNRHSLYVRFGNKLGLLKASLDRYNQRAAQSVQSICRLSLSVKDRMHRLLNLRERGNDDPTFSKVCERGCFAHCIGAELRESHPEFRNSMDEVGRAVETCILDLMREGQMTGEIRDDCPPEDLASVLVGVFMLPLVFNQESQRHAGFVSMLSVAS
jgi:TetR/AcrR family transcriptional repressor of nem operon